MDHSLLTRDRRCSHGVDRGGGGGGEGGRVVVLLPGNVPKKSSMVWVWVYGALSMTILAKAYCLVTKRFH